MKKLYIISLLVACSLLVGCERRYTDLNYSVQNGDAFHTSEKYFSYVNRELTQFQIDDYLIRNEDNDNIDDYQHLLRVYQNDNIVYETELDGISALTAVKADNMLYIWASQWNGTGTTGAATWVYYFDDALYSGEIIAIDTNTYDTVATFDTKEDELFLTINDNKAYFYHRGYAENQGMLWWEEDKNAKIYYRDLDDFDTKHIIHTFDFDDTFHEQEVNLEQALGIDMSFMENEEYEPYLSFDVLDDKINVTFEYNFENASVPLWTTSIPFDGEVHTETFDTKITYDESITNEAVYALENMSIEVGENLQYKSELNAFITQNLNAIYQIKTTKDFRENAVSNEHKGVKYEVFDIWLGHKKYRNLETYYNDIAFNGIWNDADDKFGAHCLMQGVTNEGIAYDYNFIVNPLDDTGIIGYVNFGQDYPVELVEISCYFDSELMTDEEVVSELEEMIKSIEFK